MGRKVPTKNVTAQKFPDTKLTLKAFKKGTSRHIFLKVAQAPYNSKIYIFLKVAQTPPYNNKIIIFNHKFL